MSAEATQSAPHSANEYVCPSCHRRNEAGEYFPLAMGIPFHLAHLCPPCLQTHELNRIETQREQMREKVSRSPYADPNETQGTDEVICPYCGAGISGNRRRGRSNLRGMPAC